MDQQYPKEKASDLCNEKGCQQPIVYWLKFKGGRLGFFCEEHKELFLRQGILLRIENAQKQ
jgi:hypothetical protein